MVGFVADEVDCGGGLPSAKSTKIYSGRRQWVLCHQFHDLSACFHEYQSDPVAFYMQGQYGSDQRVDTAGAGQLMHQWSQIPSHENYREDGCESVQSPNKQSALTVVATSALFTGMKTKLPGELENLDVLALAVVGSVAYGLDTGASDVDLLGVYKVPLDLVLGLNGAQVVETTVHQTSPDFTVHELGKFMRLCLSANPTATELLWAPHYEVLTAAGSQLMQAREAFLSTQKVRSSYGRYALAQAKKLAGRQVPFTRAEKHGRHCARLLLQGRQLLSTGQLTLNVGPARDFLFEQGRAAATEPAKFLAWVESQLGKLESIPSMLADEPDRVRVNQLLVDLRHTNAQ